MFIGYYKLDNEEYFDIYYKDIYGYEVWYKNTFSPNCEDIYLLDFKVSGKNYKERQSNLEDLAKEWQNSGLSSLDWSYGELAIITKWFRKNAKRYGLISEFKENGIC